MPRIETRPRYLLPTAPVQSRSRTLFRLESSQFTYRYMAHHPRINLIWTIYNYTVTYKHTSRANGQQMLQNSKYIVLWSQDAPHFSIFDLSHRRPESPLSPAILVPHSYTLFSSVNWSIDHPNHEPRPEVCCLIFLWRQKLIRCPK